MSASTVSIMANPTTSRRRPVVAGEKKNNIGFVGDDGFNPQLNGEGGGDEKISGGVGGGKDLSRSIGGESVLERSRDLVQVKKTLATTVSPRRTRKVVPKQEKPRWVTVASVFTKNFLLLVVVLGFVQMTRKLALHDGDNSNGTTSVEISNFERRIVEAESLLQTTTKMMQVQVEVVDKKIEDEIVGLRRELSKKNEDNSVMFEEGLKKVEGRTEDLEKSLDKLKGMNLMTKEEFNKFYSELKNDRAIDSGDRDLSLDHIRASLKEMIEKEFEKHGADGLGRVDYALASGGAMVVRHSEPFIVGKGSGWFRKGTGRSGVSADAEKMLRPSFGEPGQCFPLKGSIGFVQIRLRTAIIPEAITLEHVSKSIAYDRSSAPKDCRVSGWLQGHDTDSAVEVEKFHLVEFTYDLQKSNIQTFNVLEAAGSGVVNTLRLDFTSNHGNPSHTCIYRLRVHGHEPSSVSMLAMQS